MSTQTSEKNTASVIPNEVAVRRRLDQVMEEARLLRRQLRLSRDFGDAKDGTGKKEGNAEVGG